MGALRAASCKIKKFYILFTEGIYVFIMCFREIMKSDY